MSKRKIVLLLTCLFVITTIIVGGIIWMSNNQKDEIKGIFVSSKPYKIVYYCNESFNSEGLEVGAVTKKGKVLTISSNEYVLSNFDSSKPNDNLIVYITYQELQTSFNVRVIEKPVEEVSIKDIEMYQLPTKITYEIGDNFNSNGGVIKVNYTNEEYKLINLLSNYVYGFDSSKPNDNLVLTVKYKEKGKIYTTTFSVVIKG